MSSLGVKHFEFLDELSLPETTVLVLFVHKDFVILCRFDSVPACDRQTDNSTIANTGLCIASYADALYKLNLNTTLNLLLHLHSFHQSISCTRLTNSIN